MNVALPSGVLRVTYAGIAVLALALAGCASDGGRFDPVMGTNGCDFTPVGRTYMRGGMLDYVGLRRADVLGYERSQGNHGPITMVRLRPPEGPVGDHVQRLSLAWSADRSGNVFCRDESTARVCIARAPSPFVQDVIIHFDPDVVDAEARTRALVDYFAQEVVCSPEGGTFPQ